MVFLEEDTDQFINSFLSVSKGISPTIFQDVQLEILQEGHPLVDFLDGKFCPLPCVVASSPHKEQVHEESVIAEEEKSMESYEGSPMKLRSISSPEDLKSTKHSVSQPLYWPVSVDKARSLVSQYTMQATPGETCPPLVVICDGKDAEGVAILGAHKQLSASGSHEIRIYTATVKGPMPSKTKFTAPGILVKELDFRGLNAVDAHCTCSFDVYRSNVQDSTFHNNHGAVDQQGALRILCDWRTLTQPLQTPYLDAATVVEAHVLPGDMKSAAYNFYKDICLLKGLVNGLEDGTVFWYTSEAEETILDRLKRYFTRCSRKWEKREGEEVEPAFEQLIISIRQNLDFTEDIWNILKDCQCFQDLVDGFHFLVKSLSSGNFKPIIHSSSQSRLADIVTQSYMDPSRLAELSHLQPLEVLAEIGLEKVTKDHVHHLVSNDLVTAAQLDQFLSGAETLEERVVLLEKLHHAVELAVSLDQFLKLPKQALSFGAREVLKYFGDHELEKRPYVFKIPVQKKHLNGVIAGLQPAEWRATISRKNRSQHHAVVVMSPQPPFPHIERDVPVIDGFDDDQDIDGSYYQTRVFHEVICV